jgi:hypothetical protein
MSRSIRRPSAKDDKRMAHRGVRRKQNLALKACLDYDSLLLPHFLECHWNDTYCWGRDGAQMDRSYLRFSPDESSQKYYRKLLRK